MLKTISTISTISLCLLILALLLTINFSCQNTFSNVLNFNDMFSLTCMGTDTFAFSTSIKLYAIYNGPFIFGKP